MRRAVVVSLAVAALSLLVVAPAPSYDPWAWLGWGDQLGVGQLSTVEGPSFKPLPVAVCALLAPLGPAAVWLWVGLARTGAVLAVVLAYRAARRLAPPVLASMSPRGWDSQTQEQAGGFPVAGGSPVAGGLAALGVVLCGRYLELAAVGLSEGLLLALALAGAEAWRSGRPRWSLACAVAAGLVRVETWPFLVAAAVAAWRRRPQDRVLLLAAGLVVPLAWIVPEVVGSGQALRSATRARMAVPGQPGEADFPVLASLGVALALPLWPLWAGVVLAGGTAWRERDRRSGLLLVPAGVGLAWIAIVAAMARAGFSGEPRYALPGAALVAVSGAAGLVVALRRVAPAPRLAGVLAALVVTAAALPRVGDVAAIRSGQAYQWRLQADLAAAVSRVGGAEEILACGQPYVGPLRGTLLAHHLGVPRQVVEPDRVPQPPGLVFRSALHPGEVSTPAVPPAFRPVARVGLWQVFAGCERLAATELSGSRGSGLAGGRSGAGAPGGRPPR